MTRHNDGSEVGKDPPVGESEENRVHGVERREARVIERRTPNPPVAAHDVAVPVELIHRERIGATASVVGLEARYHDQGVLEASREERCRESVTKLPSRRTLG